MFAHTMLAYTPQRKCIPLSDITDRVKQVFTIPGSPLSLSCAENDLRAQTDIPLYIKKSKLRARQASKKIRSLFIQHEKKYTLARPVPDSVAAPNTDWQAENPE